jgi:hypothetical protein
MCLNNKDKKRGNLKTLTKSKKNQLKKLKIMLNLEQAQVFSSNEQKEIKGGGLSTFCKRKTGLLMRILNECCWKGTAANAHDRAVLTRKITLNTSQITGVTWALHA